MTEIVDRPCEVCEAPVPSTEDAEVVLCLEHFFTEDVTAEWEAEE